MSFTILQPCTVSPTCRLRHGVTATRKARPAAPVTPLAGSGRSTQRGPARPFEGPFVSPLRPAESQASVVPGTSDLVLGLSEPAERPAAVG